MLGAVLGHWPSVLRVVLGHLLSMLGFFLGYLLPMLADGTFLGRRLLVHCFCM